MFGYFSRSVGRSSDLKKNPYYVYDITILEWETQRQVIRNRGRVYLCKNSQDNYEVVCKRDLCYILVLFTTPRLAAAERMYETYTKKINDLDPNVPWLHKNNTIAIYREVNRAIQMNSNWTATHIAAKIGLDVYFDANSPRICEEMDKQTLPDLMTALHLAIHNANLNVVRALAEHGANLDLVDISGWNSLHFAAISTPEVLMFVLSLPGMLERAKVKTRKGCTPLLLSCFAQKLENINIFLRFGLTVSMLTLKPPFETLMRLPKTKQNPNNVDPIVKFSDSDIEKFDIDYLFYGGSPCHWTKKPKSISKFLKLGFDVDARNAKGQTALMVNTQRMRFKCMLCLLFNGADVTLVDLLGNSALHYAMLQGDINIAQALITFDSDIDLTNHNNDSPRHLISTKSGENIKDKILLYVLAALGARRCPPDKQANCNEGCHYNGRFDGKRFLQWPVFSGHKFYKNMLLKEVIKAQSAKLNERSEPNLVNMVSFDGGGVKGLITIQMIHELQKRLKRRFIDYFDWVAGTSTGSIVGVALVIGKTTKEIRSIYFRFKDQIMTGSRPYSSELLEKLLQEVIGPDITMADLHKQYRKFIIIPATLVDRIPTQLHLFRSYPSPESLLNPGGTESQLLPPMASHDKQLVWQSVRASSAAPTYFTSFGRCVDGGLMANNPTMDMLVEFNNYNYAMECKNQLDEIRKINVVVSLGTGAVVPKPFSLPESNRFISWNLREMANNLHYVIEMFSIIIDSVCNTDYHIVERNESWCASHRVPMFRLNPKLIEPMSLNEVEDGEIINCLWLTKVYMYSKKDAIDELVAFLESIPPKTPEQDTTTTTEKQQNSKSSSVSKQEKPSEFYISPKSNKV